MPKNFTPSYKFLHTHDRDWRVFQVGHLGYDSYDEDDSDEEARAVSTEEMVTETSDEDEEMLDLSTTTQTPSQPSTSTSFLQRLLGTQSSSTTPPQNKHITSSNKKRKDYHKWIEVKCLRDQPIRQISAGGYHVVILLDDGSVYTWGWGKLGQLGHGDTLNRLKPMKIKIPLVEVAYKTDTTASQAAQKTAAPSSLVVSPNAQPSSTQMKRQVERYEPRIVRVKGGGRHTILLSNDGRVFTFGCAEDGRLGHGDRNDSVVPKEVSSLRGYRVTFIESGFWHTVVATFCKKIFVFGHGEEGKLGLGHVQSQTLPTEIKELRGRGVLSASGGAWHTIILTEDQRIYTCGSHYWGQLGVGNLLKDDQQLNGTSQEHGYKINVSPSRDACYTPVEVVELRDKNIIKVVAGSNFNVCLSKSGNVYTFGCGSSGKTGHGGNITVFTPRMIQSIAHIKIKDICTGSNHTLLLSNDGRVFSFGWCRFGQLGHGNFEEQDAPKEIEALKGSKVEQITAGAFFTLVATRDPYVAEKPSFISYSKYRSRLTDAKFIFKR